METGKTQTLVRPTNIGSTANYNDDAEITRKRLDALLAVNAETARVKALFHSDRERVEADLLKNPITDRQALPISDCFSARFHRRRLLQTFSPRRETRAVKNF